MSCRCLLPSFTLPLTPNCRRPLRSRSPFSSQSLPSCWPAGRVSSSLGNLHFGRCHHLRRSAGRWAYRRRSFAIGESCIFAMAALPLGQCWPRAVTWMVHILTKLPNCETTLRFCNGLPSPCLPERLHALSPLCENKILGALLVFHLAYSTLFAELSKSDNRRGQWFSFSFVFTAARACDSHHAAIAFAFPLIGFW